MKHIVNILLSFQFSECWYNCSCASCNGIYLVNFGNAENDVIKIYGSVRKYTYQTHVVRNN